MGVGQAGQRSDRNHRADDDHAIVVTQRAISGQRVNLDHELGRNLLTRLDVHIERVVADSQLRAVHRHAVAFLHRGGNARGKVGRIVDLGDVKGNGAGLVVRGHAV